MQKKKKKVGEVSLELSQKLPDSRDPIEIGRKLLESYPREVEACAARGCEKYKKDFYIVVLLKREKLMQNVLRTYYIDTIDCPTPTWDQNVYKYHYGTGVYELLWAIPDKETADILYEHALEVIPEEQELRDYVIDFYQGKLLHKAKELNGNKQDATIIIEPYA